MTNGQNDFAADLLGVDTDQPSGNFEMSAKVKKRLQLASRKSRTNAVRKKTNSGLTKKTIQVNFDASNDETKRFGSREQPLAVDVALAS